MDPKILAVIIGVILAILSVAFGNPWMALVAIVGPVLAVLLSLLGVSGAVILSWLSGGGAIPLVAGVGFIVFIALSIYSLFL